MKFVFYASLGLLSYFRPLYSESNGIEKFLASYPFGLYAQCAVRVAQAERGRIVNPTEYSKYLRSILNPKVMRSSVKRRLMKQNHQEYNRYLLESESSELSKKIQKSQYSFLKQCVAGKNIFTIEFAPVRETVCTEIFLNLDLDVYGAYARERPNISAEMAALRKYAPVYKNTSDDRLRKQIKEQYELQRADYLKVRLYKNLPKDLKAEFCGQYAELSDQDMESVKQLSKKKWYKHFTKHLTLGVYDAQESGTRKYAFE